MFHQVSQPGTPETSAYRWTPQLFAWSLTLLLQSSECKLYQGPGFQVFSAQPFKMLSKEMSELH